jgi:hypothetical protein
MIPSLLFSSHYYCSKIKKIVGMILLMRSILKIPQIVSNFWGSLKLVFFNSFEIKISTKHPLKYFLLHL